MSKPTKLTESISFQLLKEKKAALVLRSGNSGEVSKVLRRMVDMFLNNEIKVVLPGTAEKVL